MQAHAVSLLEAGGVESGYQATHGLASLVAGKRSSFVSGVNQDLLNGSACTPVCVFSAYRFVLIVSWLIKNPG